MPVLRHFGPLSEPSRSPAREGSFEVGQPRGLTGRLQSIQWTAMYVATILAGSLGGYLSQHKQQHVAFLICALASGMSSILTWTSVREEHPTQLGTARQTFAELRNTAGNSAFLAAAAFLFLWNFNPFSTSVLYVHMTGHMQLSEQFYGNSVSLLSVGAIVASLLYEVSPRDPLVLVTVIGMVASAGALAAAMATLAGLRIQPAAALREE